MTDSWHPGDSRRTKVLITNDDGSCDGHRGYPVAVRKKDGAMIVIAATEGVGFVWGCMYLCEVRDPKHHHYVVTEISRIPHHEDWALSEEAIDERAGHSFE